MDVEPILQTCVLFRKDCHTSGFTERSLLLELMKQVTTVGTWWQLTACN